MGDTGSLAIGAGLGALALTTNTHLLLPVVGGLFVMITLSVVVQVRVPDLAHAGCSGWRRSTTTSSSSAGPRRP